MVRTLPLRLCWLIFIPPPPLSFPSHSFIHLSSDESTAQYLSAVLPHDSRVEVRDLRQALEDTRRRSPTSKLETRVAEAVASLGIR